MKKTFPLFVLSLLFQISFGQNFTWVKGPNTSGNIGNYGTMGVSAPTNNPGGRNGSGKWTDAAGNLWLFGGEGYSTNDTICWMNDLWKYNPSSNEWTWIRGSNTANSTGSYGTIGITSPANDPPARAFTACWTDNSGNFWMFGGEGAGAYTYYGPQQFADLWKYDPNLNQWTWINGAASVYVNYVIPSNRMGSATWTDATGNLLMFGGAVSNFPFDYACLSDFWRYNIASNQWTMLSIPGNSNPLGIYGSIGVPSTTNIPGGRYLPTTYKDLSGNLYLFGGRGFGTTLLVGYLNDLWKFDPVNLTWTWIHGVSFVNVASINGTLGVSSPATFPSGLIGAASWTDASGNFWVFGGHGKAPTNNVGVLNDLFRYNPNLNEWTWMKGSAIQDQLGTYGTQGVSATSNMPGGREYTTWWKDHNENLWLFGGEGMDISSTSSDQLCDLWKYKLPCNPDSVVALPGKNICSNQSLTLTAINADPATNWYTGPTSTNIIGSGTHLAVNNLSTSVSSTVYNYYAGSYFCTAQPRSSISITVNSLPIININSSDSIICLSNSSTLTANGALNYIWNTVPAQTGSTIIVSPNNTTNYEVTGTGSNGCKQSQTITQIVDLCESIPFNKVEAGKLVLFPNPNNGNFTIKLSNFNTQQTFIIFNVIGQQVFSKFITEEQCYLQPELSKGIYIYKLVYNERIVEQGKLIIQ